MVARLDVSGLPRHRLKAVGILVLGVAVSATQDATIKFISTEYPFHEMQFIRSAAALPLILVLTLRRREFGAAIHAGASGLLHLRSLMLARARCSMSAWPRSPLPMPPRSISPCR
jgi:hypothetical protein